MAGFFERYQYIAIEGTIGVGKTSLAQKLSLYFNIQAVLEHAKENPFLEDYYVAERKGALSAQLFFLFQRLDQLQALSSQKDQTQRVITDYIFEKNDVFAKVSLNEQEQNLYERVCQGVSMDRLPKPDLVLWLQADPVTLMARIQKRGIPMERRIGEPYLEALSQGYAKLFQDYQQAPVFVINTQMFNPLDNDEHFSLLLEKIDDFRGSRGYFNPQM